MNADDAKNPFGCGSSSSFVTAFICVHLRFHSLLHHGVQRCSHFAEGRSRPAGRAEAAGAAHRHAGAVPHRARVHGGGGGARRGRERIQRLSARGEEAAAGVDRGGILDRGASRRSSRTWCSHGATARAPRRSSASRASAPRSSSRTRATSRTCRASCERSAGSPAATSPPPSASTSGSSRGCAATTPASARVTAFLEIWNRPLTTIAGRHFMNEALEICGARNVVPGSRRRGARGARGRRSTGATRT